PTRPANGRGGPAGPPMAGPKEANEALAPARGPGPLERKGTVPGSRVPGGPPLPPRRRPEAGEAQERQHQGGRLRGARRPAPSTPAATGPTAAAAARGVEDVGADAAPEGGVRRAGWDEGVHGDPVRVAVGVGPGGRRPAREGVVDVGRPAGERAAEVAGEA